SDARVTRPRGHRSRVRHRLRRRSPPARSRAAGLRRALRMVPDPGPHTGGVIGGVPRLADPAALTDRAALEPIVGAIASVSSAPLATPGFSGSTHERLTLRLGDGSTRTLVLKRTRIAD